MAMLTLTPAQARTVLHACENQMPGPGHTLKRHVNITNLEL